MTREVEMIEIAAVENQRLSSAKAYAVDAGMVDLQGKPVITWLPKSQCRPGDEKNVFLVPEWLAKDKGLI